MRRLIFSLLSSYSSEAVQSGAIRLKRNHFGRSFLADGVNAIGRRHDRRPSNHKALAFGLSDNDKEGDAKDDNQWDSPMRLGIVEGRHERAESAESA